MGFWFEQLEGCGGKVCVTWVPPLRCGESGLQQQQMVEGRGLENLNFLTGEVSQSNVCGFKGVQWNCSGLSCIAV